MPQDISSLISTNLHPHDSRLWPSQHSHIPVCMLVASTDSRPTGVAAQHLLNLGNSQQPWAAARPKWSSQFLLSPWNVSTNPHLAFVCASQDNQLPDRCVLRKLPRSQHWPSLIMSTRWKFLPTAMWWNVGTVTRLIESVFALQENPLRDYHLRTQQTSIRHVRNYARTCYLRLNNVAHVTTARTVPHWVKECEILYHSFLEP